MIEKSFRLSSGFWHVFFPNSNKLFSPQNIPLEIWDIEKKAKERKWNPGIYGIKSIVFSSSGDKFVIEGGWVTNRARTEYYVFETDSLNCIDEFFIPVRCTNVKFTNGDKNLIFGTWYGDIFYYCLETKELAKQFTLSEAYKFDLIHQGKSTNKLYFVTTKIAAENASWFDFIFEYDVTEKAGKKMHFDEIIAPYERNGKTYNTSIKGLTLHNENLAILATTYGGKIDDDMVDNAKVYVYNIATKETILIKENFKTPTIFDRGSSIVWNNSGSKLVFIGLCEVSIVDFETRSETIIPFERATSVAFSNCDTGLAVGGDKAKLFRVNI